MALEVGSVVEGKVTGITNFGAFVELEGGKTGLVHISEIADAYVRDIKDYVKENDIVKVKIINIHDGKIGLSIRQASSPGLSGPPRERRRPPTRSFEDRLARFLKESDERLMDLKRATDAKRGGRGGRSRP
ncbi:MAG: S1 RNA-binding domain-containing protein [Limnochordaceae bacterium]|nr:S1 RNA-binding domain-containing protein [Limnochordaceae bacterium]